MYFVVSLSNNKCNNNTMSGIYIVWLLHWTNINQYWYFCPSLVFDDSFVKDWDIMYLPCLLIVLVCACTESDQALCCMPTDIIHTPPSVDNVYYMATRCQHQDALVASICHAYHVWVCTCHTLWINQASMYITTYLQQTSMYITTYL